MLLSQKRIQTRGLLVLVLLAVLVLQVMPVEVTADGTAGDPPPPAITDTIVPGIHCVPGVGDATESLSLWWLDLLLLLAPLL